METITINAQGKILGRLASEISLILQGKNKPNFLYHQKEKICVVVKNVEDIKLTGKKENKPVRKHSGYLGSLKLKILSPQERLKRAVYLMLPKNKQRKNLIKNLIFYGEK